MEHSLTGQDKLREHPNPPADAGELFARYHQSVYRYLVYRTGNEIAAEDLTGDVFVKMIHALPSYRSMDGVPFKAWLFQIARNTAIDYFRRSGVLRADPLEEERITGAPAAERQAAARLTVDSLQKAIHRLGDAQRDVLLLRFVEGFSLEETAGILHKSIDSIKALQRRALIVLRAVVALEEEADG